MSLFLFLLRETRLNKMFKIFSYDSLTLFDGDSNGSPILGKYCGTSIPPNHISSSNKIFIHFETNGEIRKPGFKLEYHPFSKTYSYSRAATGGKTTKTWVLSGFCNMKYCSGNGIGAPVKRPPLSTL